jgi:Uma2 family endonuclease
MLFHALLPTVSRAEQIMAMPAPLPSQMERRRWTAAEVRRLIDENPLLTPRYELVDGELLVTPSPAWVHQRAVSILLGELLSYLRREPVGRASTSPMDIELEPESIVQPDVFVLPVEESRRLIGKRIARVLMLAAEVLSPSSGRHDRVTKRPIFQRHVGEYWIVDLEARLFERWRPGDERPEILLTTIEWHPGGATEPFVLDLPRYFAEVFEEL